jgi:hypothetical protein
VYGKPAHNKRLALRRLSAARVPQNRVRAYALCTVLLHHILPALALLRKPLSGLAKRRQPGTLSEIKIELVGKYEN